MRLFEYQKKGVEFLRSQSGILADEMGLGKTAQVLAALPDDCRVVVVAPKMLLEQWRFEAGKFRPDLTVGVWGVEGKADILGFRFNILVVNYENFKYLFGCRAPKGYRTASKGTGVFDQTRFDVLIVDEAHRVKNVATQAWQRCYQASQRATRVWCLTGTPVSESPVNFWSLVKLCGFDGGKWEFIKRFFDPVLGFNGHVKGFVLRRGLEGGFARFRAGFMLRRLKRDVLGDLPNLKYLQVACEPSKNTVKQLELMRSKSVYVVDDVGVRVEPHAMGVAWRLHELESGVFVDESDAVGGVDVFKFERVLDFYRANGGCWVVFCVSRKVADAFSGFCVGRGVSCVVGAGSVGVFEQVKTGFLVLNTAQSEGLNLQFADGVIFLQRAWSMVANLQAEGRVHRVGGVGVKKVVDFLVLGGFDERVLAGVTAKQVMAGLLNGDR